MDRLRALEIFVAVAEAGGFAAAGRATGASPPAVTRAVAGLERRLATRLFVRTTRAVRLTEAGERFLADARRILAELQEAEDAAAGAHGAARGEIRVTAPVLFGRLFVAPLLGDFVEAHPAVTCHAVFVDRMVALVEEGIDIAVRIGDLPDSGLTAVRVGAVRRVVVGAPGYLDRAGRPVDPRDLADHRIVASTAAGAGPDWRFVGGDGRLLTVSVPARLTVSTNDAAIDLAEQGRGLTRLLSYQVAAPVAEGRLERVLDAFAPPPLPVHVVHAEGRAASRKIRAAVDHLVAGLRADPALDRA
ncbi:MAG: LysR substrate-binding domain-containing protein [Azospirillaceae bacterium]